jgi:hypothetical protein
LRRSRRVHFGSSRPKPQKTRKADLDATANGGDLNWTALKLRLLQTVRPKKPTRVEFFNKICQNATFVTLRRTHSDRCGADVTDLN